MRVVSMVPSVTESLLHWGVVPVACTRFCEQPTLAHVGGTKDPDVAAIVALAPDLVVVCGTPTHPSAISSALRQLLKDVSSEHPVLLLFNHRFSPLLWLHRRRPLIWIEFPCAAF